MVLVLLFMKHMLRASYKAMKKTAMQILKNKRSFNIEKDISSVKEIITLKEE